MEYVIGVLIFYFALRYLLKPLPHQDRLSKSYRDYMDRFEARERRYQREMYEAEQERLKSKKPNEFSH